MGPSSLGSKQGTIRFYVNGKVDGEFYYPVTLGDDRPCRVGIDLAGANGYIGYIDEVRITKGVGRNRRSYKLPGLPMANF